MMNDDDVLCVKLVTYSLFFPLPLLPSTPLSSMISGHDIPHQEVLID